jgi:hypothetical protein
MDDLAEWTAIREEAARLLSSCTDEACLLRVLDLIRKLGELSHAGRSEG